MEMASQALSGQSGKMGIPNRVGIAAVAVGEQKD